MLQSFHPRVAIVTDDFTSATDGTACFASQGWRCKIVRDGQSIPRDADVVSIDTASRVMSPAFGQARIHKLSGTLRRAHIIVKQFDSVLRGHVAGESMAALRSAGRRNLLVLAAFPSAGRTTVDGVQLCHGQPVHITEFANDPRNPVRSSSLVSLFFGASARSVENVSSAADALTAFRTVEVVVADAQSEEEVDSIVSQLWSNPDIAWAGSTGLLRALARTLPGAPKQVASLPVLSSRPLLVVGSLHGTTREQLLRFTQGGGTSIQLDPLSQPAAAARCVLALSNSKAVAITALARRVDPASAAIFLADVASRVLRAGGFDGLVVTGGDTAHHVLRGLEFETIQVLSEIEPGVPHCLAHGADRVIPVITKAGAFGSDTILLKATSVLRGAKPGTADFPADSA